MSQSDLPSQDSLEKLQDLHRELELEIEQESNCPEPDNLKISELKRRKLQIKDDIYRLNA